jgi:hypothetical protein
MWDWATVLRDRHFQTQIVIEASAPTSSEENAFVSIAGNFWNSKWVVRSARPAGATPPQDFFPALAQVTINSAFLKSSAGWLCTNDQVMQLVADAETNPRLSRSSRNQIAAFKKIAHACGWRKRPANMDFGIPRIPMAPKEEVRPSLAEVRLHM